MQFWNYEILILVLLKTGSGELCVHGGDTHGTLEEDMLDVLPTPIYLDIYIQGLGIWIKFCNQFCI
jgi:hypothetical protein